MKSIAIALVLAPSLVAADSIDGKRPFILERSPAAGTRVIASVTLGFGGTQPVRDVGVDRETDTFPALAFALSWEKVPVMQTDMRERYTYSIAPEVSLHLLGTRAMALVGARLSDVTTMNRKRGRASFRTAWLAPRLGVIEGGISPVVGIALGGHSNLSDRWLFTANLGYHVWKELRAPLDVPRPAEGGPLSDKAWMIEGTGSLGVARAF